MKRFKITDQDGKESFWSLDREGDSLSIGRSGDCDIVLADDLGLSRFHCRIVYCNGELVLQDCHSRNGVYEDGVRVDSAAVLPGHTYSMGMSFLFVEPDSPLSPPAPAVARPAPRAARRATKGAALPAKAARRAIPSKRSIMAARELQSRPEDVAGLPSSFHCVLALQVPPDGFCGGACLQFRFRAAEKCYLHLLHVDPNGAVTHLVGGGTGDNTVAAGVDTCFPPIQDSECDYVLAPPYGDDVVLALACTEPRDITPTLRDWAAASVSDPIALACAVILENSPGTERWSCAMLHFVSRE